MTFTDHLGTNHKYLELGPKLVETMCKHAWHHKLARNAATSLGMGLQTADLLHAKQLLRPKIGLSPVEIGSMVNFLVGGLWTRTRASNKGYVAGSTLCELCEEAEDTSEHRLLFCKATAAVRETIMDPLTLWRYRNDLNFRAAASGFYEHPSTWAEAPAAEGERFWSFDNKSIEDEFGTAGDFFLDGSCTKCWHPALNLAAWAIIKLRPDLQGPQAVLHGPVWASLSQSSPCVEHAALAAFSQLAPPHSKAYIDYSQVVCARPHAKAHNDVFAGVVRSASLGKGWGNFSRHKVKAHQNLHDPSLVGEEKYIAVGNFFADDFAKQTFEFMPSTEETELKRREEIFWATQKLCLLAAETLPLWSKLEKRGRAPSPLLAQDAVVAPAAQTPVDRLLHS